MKNIIFERIHVKQKLPNHQRTCREHKITQINSYCWEQQKPKSNAGETKPKQQHRDYNVET